VDRCVAVVVAAIIGVDRQLRRRRHSSFVMFVPFTNNQANNDSRNAATPQPQQTANGDSSER